MSLQYQNFQEFIQSHPYFPESEVLAKCGWEPDGAIWCNVFTAEQTKWLNRNKRRAVIFKPYRLVFFKDAATSVTFKLETC